MKYYTEIVPFDLAKELKEAGYKEECSGHYAKDGHLWETHPKQNSNDTENFFSAPTYAEVFDWLLNKSFSIEIQSDIHGLWKGFVAKWKYSENLAFVESEEWHAAADAATEKACEILKEGEK